jgi:protein-tyrosine-phosphatase
MENALNYLEEETEGLEEKKLEEYNRIVAMKPHHKEIVLNRCPICEGKIVVWNIDEQYFLSEGETKIFQQIKDAIKDLANTI